MIDEQTFQEMAVVLIGLAIVGGGTLFSMHWVYTKIKKWRKK